MENNKRLEMEPLNLSNLREQLERKHRHFLDNMSRWEYDPRTTALVHLEIAYLIDLRKINDKEEFFEQIIHLNDQEWITAEDLKEFIDAILIIKQIV